MVVFSRSLFLVHFGIMMLIGYGVYGLSSSRARHKSQSKVSGRERRTANPKTKGDMEEMMDSKIDFSFNWEGKPPEFIPQLDLEFKWDDGNEVDSTPNKVSIQNITMNQDHHMGPMTHLMTTIANHSFHNIRSQLSSSEAPPPKLEIESAPRNISDYATCSCDEIQTLFKNVQVLKGETGRRGRRGHKGDQGEKGLKGTPGLSIVGPKGEPGHPGLLPYHLLYPETSRLKGEPGPPGPPGPPGACSSSCSNSVATPTPANIKSPFNKPNYRIVPGALVFKTFPSMLKMAGFVMIGSVSFVEETEEFYGKVKNGWRQFQMGPLLP